MLKVINFSVQYKSLLPIFHLISAYMAPFWASVANKFKVHKSVVLTTIPPPLPSATITIQNTKTFKSLHG